MNRRFPKVDPNDPDEVLVEQAKNAVPGDSRAFETLVRRHKGHVKANCRSLSGSESDAEDLAQEVFVKTYFALRRFEGRSKFKTWVQRIKINHCLNFLRKKKGKSFLDIDDPVTQTEPDLRVHESATKATEALGTQELVQEILETLPDTLRVPLTMCDMDGHSYQEIADSLGIGLSATKMRIKRGREEFRRRFEERNAELAGVE
ncbi:MAG: RNA polymerase sigma factor [Candidatus Eisenbacteria bacterium]|uniref:RNA polymerase sigma factor n=1 Tax=Eiseniibacteriota bacterium TaxID=2212470 RepID=A0A956SFV9_UNCEI|nr:RNA polymerase sigma factor [Candidatus Eisenbacteria bacterium]MCB9465833.1 RNA polymerase sigma factor [Candidatus Eisenbacteria bacterium]